jgi:hypothetical protein
MLRSLSDSILKGSLIHGSYLITESDAGLDLCSAPHVFDYFGYPLSHESPPLHPKHRRSLVSQSNEAPSGTTTECRGKTHHLGMRLARAAALVIHDVDEEIDPRRDAFMRTKLREWPVTTFFG